MSRYYRDPTSGNLLPTAGYLKDSQNQVTTFTSDDVASDSDATSWTTVSKLNSGETHSSIMNKISKMFKNIRFLKNDVDELNASLKFYTKTTASLASGSSETFNLPSGFDADKVIAIPYYKIADSWYRYAPASEEFAVDIDGRQSPVLVTVRNDHSGARAIKVNFIQIS